MARLARLVATMVVAWGLVLAAPAMAQQGPDHPDYANALEAQVAKLYGEGKYSEAIPLAERVLVIREKVLGPEHPHVATGLSNLAALYLFQGRYAEAEPMYKRAFAIREKALGAEHPSIAAPLYILAALYKSQGRYAEAEPLYKRSLAINEKALGPEHPDVATPLYILAALYKSQGRYDEAEPLYKRSLAIREKALPPTHPDLATTLNNLAGLYLNQGRYGEAEPMYRRSLEIFEKAFGREHPSVATSLHDLAVLCYFQGRFAEAEPLQQRSLAIREKALPPEHPEIAASLQHLADLYRDLGRYGEAEPLYRRSLAIVDKVLRPDDPDVATGLESLAMLYLVQGRIAAAEPLVRRSMEIREKALPPNDPFVALSLSNMAGLYMVQGRFGEAEPLLKRALAMMERARGPDDPNVAVSLINLAELYQVQARASDAEPLKKRALAINEKALGPMSMNVAASLYSLAGLYSAQGRYAEAEPMLKRAFAIYENAVGPVHPLVAGSLGRLAELYFEQGRWSHAANEWRRSTGILIRRSERGTRAADQVLGTNSVPALTGKAKSEAELSDWQFGGLVKATHRQVIEEPKTVTDQAAEMFHIAQWARSSEAAASLAQMAVRGATGEPKLAAIVRERQDLVSEWQAKDKVQISAVSQPSEKRNKEAETSNVARLAAIDARIADIDKQLVRDFPDYAALASPKPLTIADVQSLLRDDEALVLFLDTPEAKPLPEETFIWVVTRTDGRWVRSDLGTAALSARVATLRCGLDSTNWIDASAWPESTEDEKNRRLEQRARRERCKQLTGNDVSGNAAPPFDLAKAQELYQALFSGIEDLIKDKSLLIVPSGALTQLPFQVLITGKLDPAAETQPTGLTFGTALSRLSGPPKHNKEAQKVEASISAGETPTPWLIRRHAITVLPSVASLKALRQNAKTSKAASPFVGFGNPLLTGPDGKNKSAWAKKSCPKQAPKPDRAVVAGWTPPETFAKLFARGMADVAALKRQSPLPETTDELCAVARELGAGESDVNLGALATETRIRDLNAKGALAQARVVHFATHGLIASETETVAKSLAEPALLLTPPDVATATDDGLLTASEVTELKLNAEWVVLSACNTAAAGEKGNAEALSGLARAFFYAGARALLVSHWYVDSQAAVKITTGAFAELKRDPKIGRAEALRRSMLAAMADTTRPKTWTPAAHPSVWAPFVLVGEGGEGR